MSRWRLIEDEAADGPWNMGLDEALASSALLTGRGVLRLYRWRGPWLSLGYAQRRIDRERLDACREAGVGIVRRTTGGGAVLHGADLTYAIVAPEALLRPGLRGAYDQVSRALLAAIRALGLEDARRAPLVPGPRGATPFDCFAQPAGDEICVAGRKLVGSAQRRRQGVVLQHGSIRMAADPSGVSEAAGLDRAAAISLEELGWAADEGALRGALVAAFATELDAEFEVTRADRSECAEARERVASHARDVLSAPSPSRISPHPRG